MPRPGPRSSSSISARGGGSDGGGTSGTGYPGVEAQPGMMMMLMTQTVPEGWLLCNGAAVSRTDYIDLYSAIGTLYGSGDGSTTFNLPDCRDVFIEGAGTNSLGVGLNAGVPELAGTFVTRQDMMLSGEPIALIYLSGRDGLPYLFSSRVELDGETAAPHATTNEWGNTNNHAYYFRASHLNSTYSDSCSTVQPPALSGHFVIKY